MSIEILTEVKIKFEEVFKNDRKEQLFYKLILWCIQTEVIIRNNITFSSFFLIITYCNPIHNIMIRTIE